MAEQKLSLTAQTQGFDQAATAVKSLETAQGNLSEAQDQVQQTTEKLIPEQEALNQTQESLNASTEDYARILNRIAPGLGQWVQGIGSAIRAAGELSQKNFTLTGAFEALTGGLGKYAGALKLAGAAGFAITAFNFLIDRLSEAKKKADEAREALERFNKAQTDIERRDTADAGAIVAARDASGRDPFTFEQQKSIEQTLHAAPEDIREKLGPLLQQFGGAAGFGEGGPFTGGELEDLARSGFKPDETKRPEWNMRRAAAYLHYQKSDIAAIHERERKEHQAVLAAAREEALSPPESTMEGAGNLAELAEEVAGRTGTDPELIARTASEDLRKRRDLRERGVQEDVVEHYQRNRREERPAPVTAAVEELIRKLDVVVNELRHAPRKVEINQPNARNIGFDAESFRKRAINAEKIGRDAEF